MHIESKNDAVQRRKLITLRTILIISLFSVVALASAIAQAAADNGPSRTVISNINKSLAFIVIHEGKSVASGTGFCIGSHDNTAYILTNRHVVGTDLRPRIILLSDPTSELYGRIDRTSTLDAAVIAVPNSRCDPLKLNAELPAIGTAIGIAGFPAFQIAMAPDLTSIEPSVHAGAITALPSGSGFLEYDAQTDHGNSGSPLFDAETGDIFGIVTLVNTGTTGALQNNLAISVMALKSFLSNSNADVVFSGTSEPPTPAAPAALPTGTTVAAYIDTRCGSGSFPGFISTLNRAAGELNANDYAKMTQDERALIETVTPCAIKFSCPGLSCNEQDYSVLLGIVLEAQQNLRTVAARTNADLVDSLRNELFTTTILCGLPSIMSDAQPYNALRIDMKHTLKLSLEVQAIGPYRGVTDAPNVRDCATKLDVR